jgi:hypothetical protein
VARAYGRFWADGHECFNLRQVTARSKVRDGEFTETVAP